ncbi:MAG: hypothetical protein K2M17_04865 [Bacilli bacterium]|nr:hypothetical protein [Bacilli bacterium]
MNRKLQIKKFDFESIKKFLIKHKVPTLIICVGILLACISVYVSYAFFQIKESDPIIGGRVGKIADLDIRIMAQDRDAQGNAKTTYSVYSYIPKAGYQYNASKSYCSNGGTIVYNNYQATIKSSSNDTCYLYFDSTASLDLTLNVLAENLNENGTGDGTYSKIDLKDLTAGAYKYNASKSSCTNSATLSYDASNNKFYMDAPGKSECTAYMDAVGTDINLKIFLQEKRGSETYYEANEIPSNNYVINELKSSCTGTSTMSFSNRKIIINATSKTSCVAYLDIIG